MAIVVQSASFIENTGPNTVCAMPSGVTAGNLFVIMIGNIGGSDSPTETFSDSLGLTFTSQIVVTNVGGTQSSCQILTAPITSSGAETITRTSSSSNYPVAVWILEVGSFSTWAMDATSSGQANGGTSVNTGNVTSSNTDLLLVGVASDNTGNAFDSASPSGSTTAFVSAQGGFLYKFLGAGTYSCTFNKSSGGVRYSSLAGLLSFTGTGATNQPMVFVIT